MLNLRNHDPKDTMALYEQANTVYQKCKNKELNRKAYYKRKYIAYLKTVMYWIETIKL